MSDAVDGARSRTGGRRLACGVTPGRALRCRASGPAPRPEGAERLRGGVGLCGAVWSAPAAQVVCGLLHRRSGAEAGQK